MVLRIFDPEVKELIQYGALGVFLITSLSVNMLLWRRLQACHADKLEMLERHEQETAALYDRFMSARDTVIEKYHDFVRQSDRTMNDMLRMLQAKGDRRG